MMTSFDTSEQLGSNHSSSDGQSSDNGTVGECESPDGLVRSNRDQ